MVVPRHPLLGGDTSGARNTCRMQAPPYHLLEDMALEEDTFRPTRAT